MDLHLQALIEGGWQTAATLQFDEPAQGKGGSCTVEYDFDYLARWIAAPPPLAAVSLNLPVEFGPVVSRRWPSFLDDIRPLGSARSFWLRRRNLPDEPASELQLLRWGTVAPIGNLRIAEALPSEQEAPKKFRRRSVIEREHDFLEFAANAGAQIGGATGAGGDSPKLLLRQNARKEVWIDVRQDDPACPDPHFLVKFARTRRERDRTILRSEYVYYRALAALGIDTVSQDGLSLEEGPSGPSLWMPRFDVVRKRGREVRYGVESIYSLVQAEPGAFLTHQAVLEALKRVVPDEDWPKTQEEYLKRDLLNLVFGNSDNHGRNTAVLKTERTVRLSPVYDFAPMKMDLEGITRTTQWAGHESGGEVDWQAVLHGFGKDGPRLRAGLHALALKLRKLPKLLRDLGLPEETLEFPALGFNRTEEQLSKWGLL